MKSGGLFHRFRDSKYLFGTAAIAIVSWELVWLLSDGIGFFHSWAITGFILEKALSPEFWGSIFFTISLTLLGLVGGAAIAIGIGYALVNSPFLENSARGSLFFMRAIPSVAIIPLLLATIGSRLALVVSLVIWMVVTKLIFFVMRAIQDQKSSFTEQARLLQLEPWQLLFYVRVPSALGMIMTGVRLTVNRAYGAVVLAGLIAGTPGIGRDLYLARVNADYEAFLGFAVIAALVGVLFFWVFKEIESRTVRWRTVS